MLQAQRSAPGGVSELWTVAFRELDIQKQIGEGSFGKVFLAKWRETTVAVKVLGSIGGGGSYLDEEFPDAAAAKGHPLYESLQKEAAMMASLRHPSIVMYLGVCLDPPAVVTEYCARGAWGAWMGVGVCVWGGGGSGGREVGSRPAGCPGLLRAAIPLTCSPPLIRTHCRVAERRAEARAGLAPAGGTARLAAPPQHGARCGQGHAGGWGGGVGRQPGRGCLRRSPHAASS